MSLLTPEQDAFVREAYKTTPRHRLADSINTEFGTNFTPNQLVFYVKNHKITCGRSGQFKPGNVPLYINHDRNRTSFRKGNVPANIKPLGHERICAKDGYILIKIAEPNPYTGAPTRYRAKHQVVWMEKNGPIPKGHVVVFLDGDKMNCDQDNLRCVPRGVLQYMNKNGLNNSMGEARKAAILTAEVVTKTFSLRKASA